MKRRSRKKPVEKPIRVDNYQELTAFLTAFSAGHINLIILVGAPGLAKSRTVKSVLADACWIEGNASPFGMYLKLYHERGKFVVIDDVDSLYADRNGIRLLKCLCQTEEQKTVAWPSAARDLKREGVPREFVTRSRVVIVTNEWRTLNKNVAALQDRGHTILFEPTPAEVHARVGEWFEDDEIYDWVGSHLHLVDQPSMRRYVRGLELKRAGLDWKQIMPLAPENKRVRLVLELLADDTLATQEARAKEFIFRGGGCRATYFNHLRRAREKGITTMKCIDSVPHPNFLAKAG